MTHGSPDAQGPPSDSAQPDTSPPWRAGGLRLAALLGVAGLLVAVGFGLGARLSSPVTQAADDMTAVRGWSTVVLRSAAGVPALTGRVRGGQTTAVKAVLPAGVSRLVVTDSRRRAGAKVRSGDVLAVVSGRPVILVRADFPFYRDLVPGAQGADVRELQRVLARHGVNAGTDGVFGAATQQALTQFYGRRGLTPLEGGPNAQEAVEEAVAARRALGDGASPQDISRAEQRVTAARLAAGARLPLGELATISQDSAVVVSSARRGAVLTDESAVATLRLGDLQLVARADALAVPEYRKGRRVSVRLPGAAPLAGRVVAVGAFVEGGGDEASFPGRDVTVAFDQPPRVAAGTAGSMQVDQEATSQSPAVPLTSVREDAQGTFVLKRGEGGRPVRTGVTVTGQAEGYALVDAAGLAVGDHVQVGP